MSNTQISGKSPFRRKKTRPPASARRSALTPAQKQEVGIIVRRANDREFDSRFFVTGAAPTVATTAVITSITDVVQGNTDSNRDADSLRLESLLLKYNFVTPVANAINEQLLRVAIFQWFPDTANNAPTSAQLFLNDPVLAGISPRSCWSHDHTANGEPQFRVLYDALHHIVGVGSLAQNSTSGGLVVRNVNLSSARKNVQYSSGTTDGAGKLFILVIGSTSTNSPSITWNTNIGYHSG